MHHTRLHAIIIDCSEDTYKQGVAFWSGALGLPAKHSGDPTDPYTALEGGANGLNIEVQSVGATSRIHLDIQTDDVDAEVQRLEKLGASRVEFVENRWWVMRDPAGNLFCVVPNSDPNFAQTATNTWE